MNPTGNNKMYGASQVTVNTDGLTAGQMAARHRRAAAGAGVVPPRRKTRGLPQNRLRHNGVVQSRPIGSKVKGSSGLMHRHRAKIVITFALVMIAMIVLTGMVWAYRSFSGSSLFTLRQIEIRGAVRTSPDELKKTLQQKIGRESLWRTDLRALHTEVMKYAWVREAQIERVLPDTLLVTISEREPFALARRANGSVVWVDQEGRVLGDRAAFKNQTVPPIINGLDELDAQTVSEANRQRLRVYQQVMSDLDKEEPKLSDKVDEIMLSDVQDVRLRLTEGNIRVMLGETNFQKRFQSALRTLENIRKKDLESLGLLNASDGERVTRGDHISYLNARRDDRVLVGFAE